MPGYGPDKRDAWTSLRGGGSQETQNAAGEARVVASHGVIGGVLIASEDRLDDSHVLLVRLRQPQWLRLRLRLPERRKSGAQISRHAGKRRIVCAVADHIVEHRVEREVARLVVISCQIFGFQMAFLKCATFDGAHPLRCQACTKRFQFALRIEHIRQLIYADPRNDTATVRNKIDKASSAELSECFADRCARDAELGREQLLVELVSRRQITSDNLGGQ